MSVLLTIEETRKHLRVSKVTVYRMVKRNEITAHRVGHQLRIESRSVPGYPKDYEADFQRSVDASG